MNNAEYIAISMLNPYKSVKNQEPIMYIATHAQLAEFSGFAIDVINQSIGYQRYVKWWCPVEIISIETKAVVNGKGIIEEVDTCNGKAKVIFTELICKVIRARTPSGAELVGYYVELLKNLALVARDGYIPLDKAEELSNMQVVQRNKRKLIKRSADCIHNELQSVMGYVIDNTSYNSQFSNGYIDLSILVSDVINIEKKKE